VYFAGLGGKLGSGKLIAEAEKIGINREIPFDISLKRSTFPNVEQETEKADTAAASIGQGKLLVTPLQIALTSACIANDGVIMKPRLVKRILSPKGGVVSEPKPEVYDRSISAATAKKVAEAMREVVVSGSGKKAAVIGIKVAGKTGTAQNELSIAGNGAEHAWFTGFAPYDNPKIAVAVILEYSGSSGGNAAAPIAAKIIREYMNNLK
jgi:peptidoglycan glycosyltransferase